MVVGKVQEHLEAIYGVRCAMRANDFVVDREAAQQLGGTGRANEELLLIETEPGELEVALFLAPELLAHLGSLAESGGDGHLDARLSVGGDDDLEAFLLQREDENALDVQVVINDEDLRGSHARIPWRR